MLSISILYEDNHLLVVEKPVNVPVQGDSSNDAHMVDILKDDLKKRYQKPGNVYLGLIHRLDRPVGGVMVFAKTSKAAGRLSDQSRRRALDRSYLAIVHRTMPDKSGKLVDYLYKNSQENKVYVSSPNHKEAKKAILTYEQIEVFENLSLVSVKLHTGRPHQIRVQLAAAGCPIYGDQKYGEGITKKGAQIALWAHQLQFKHPTKDESVFAKSIPPINSYPWTEFIEGIGKIDSIEGIESNLSYQ